MACRHFAIASDVLHIILFTLMAGGASFTGHAFFAMLFAGRTAGRDLSDSIGQSMRWSALACSMG